MTALPQQVGGRKRPQVASFPCGNTYTWISAPYSKDSIWGKIGKKQTNKQTNVGEITVNEQLNDLEVRKTFFSVVKISSYKTE